MNVVDFCSSLLKCKSVTPNDDGAICCIHNFLSSIGFDVRIFQNEQSKIKNLFASYGDASSSKSLGFLGHSDVVPAGDGWDHDAFGAIIIDDFLVGRGAADMKGGIAAFCCAASQFIQCDFDGNIKIFITGDEEIGTYDGARSLIAWAVKNHQIPHDCIIGEPSSEIELGDRVYLGHRGSLNVLVKSVGKQGHVAYPNNFQNSLTSLCVYITKIKEYKWKHDDKRFPKTNLEPTMLFTNNYACNVVPDESSANLSIRFGGDYQSEDLQKILESQNADQSISFEYTTNGEAYYCEDARLKQLIFESIKEITGLETKFSAAGGTSDGRYMIEHCNVIEFGLQDSTIHQKNEKIKINDLENLEKIYLSFLKKYFS